ncbi:transketolase C-terminal domain-containing protein [Streptomyces sp. NPDC008001]|uniref:transketolase C-terminal domain-containing protein n=1 Tax=Streptomyces sp. NPDC008001 TaxID=3364804 RepID=UPI0036E831EE
MNSPSGTASQPSSVSLRDVTSPQALRELAGALRRARSRQCPVVVHVVTVKGKGYPPAEADEAGRFHAVGVIDPAPDAAALARLDGIDVLHRSARHPLDVLLVAAGTTAETVLQAADELERHGVGSTVVDPRWLTR